MKLKSSGSTIVTVRESEMVLKRFRELLLEINQYIDVNLDVSWLYREGSRRLMTDLISSVNMMKAEGIPSVKEIVYATRQAQTTRRMRRLQIAQHYRYNMKKEKIRE